MGQVAVTLNGRTYRLMCGPGEEPRLLALSAHVGAKLDTLAAQYGQVGDDRLILMAALLVTDELFDAREHVAALERSLENPAAPVAPAKPNAVNSPSQQSQPAKSARPAPNTRKNDGS